MHCGTRPHAWSFSASLRELVGLACVAWPAFLQLQAGGGLTEASNTRHLQIAKDGLIYYDEVLTTSARLCALSGRPEFDVIYNNAVPLLEENLNEVLQLRPGQAEVFSAKTAAANEELISLETEALRGCARGPQRLDAGESAAFVMGLEYEMWKGDYSYGVQLLLTDIDNYITDARAEGWRQTVYLWTVGIVVMMLLAFAQAVINVQEEQSGTLAAEFQDHVDRIHRTRLLRARRPEDARVLAAWGIDSDVLNSVYEATIDKENPPAYPEENAKPPRHFLAPKVQNRQRGFFSRLARALSPRGMILRKTYPMSTSRMSSDATLLRKLMPRVVFLVHLVALGCLLTPPFIQLHTDGLVRMGHWLGDITELVDSIRYYDEILTGSARLCALTGDIRWMARYRVAAALQHLHRSISFFLSLGGGGGGGGGGSSLSPLSIQEMGVIEACRFVPGPSSLPHLHIIKLNRGLLFENRAMSVLRLTFRYATAPQVSTNCWENRFGHRQRDCTANGN